MFGKLRLRGTTGRKGTTGERVPHRPAGSAPSSGAAPPASVSGPPSPLGPGDGRRSVLLRRLERPSEGGCRLRSQGAPYHQRLPLRGIASLLVPREPEKEQGRRRGRGGSRPPQHPDDPRGFPYRDPGLLQVRLRRRRRDLRAREVADGCRLLLLSPRTLPLLGPPDIRARTRRANRTRRLPLTVLLLRPSRRLRPSGRLGALAHVYGSLARPREGCSSHSKPPY